MSVNHFTDTTGAPALRYEMGFKIGTTSIPDPSVFTGAESALDTMGERDATGYLHRNMVATKHPLKLEYHGITWATITTICSLLNGEKFNFTFPSPFAGSAQTIQAYTGDREFEAIWNPNDRAWVGNLKFSVIEYRRVLTLPATQTEDTMQTLSQTLQTAIAAGNPQRVLLEFFKKPDGTAYQTAIQFSNEDIVMSRGLKLTEEFNSETDLTIGLCPSAEIQFTLMNDSDQLENFEFGYFRAYLGAKITSGTPASGAKTKTFLEGGVNALYEFSMLGVFISQRPDIVRKQMIDVTANDQMTLFDVNMPSDTALGVTYPTTLSGLFTKLCDYKGVTYASSTFLNSTKAVSSRPKQFGEATMRDVLHWIAEAACSNLRMNRSGNMEFVWFTTVDRTYDEHGYSEFTPTWYETEAIDGLHIRNEDSTTEYSVGTGENAYMIQDNPFLRQSD